ncbi:MAG: lysophospholipid acyltransferase family protein [Elusimicrobiota bacterium]
MSFLRVLVPYLAYLYISFVGLTARVRWLGCEHLAQARKVKGPVLYAFWHQRQVFFTWSHRGAKVAVLVSRSQDGELIARTMTLSRIRSCRGSSSRGAAAGTREMLEALAAGCDVGISPDGPKGPARSMKPGILHLAQKLGLPIVPITTATSNKLTFNSWDKFHVPLPFSRAVVAHGVPVYVGPNDDVEAKSREVKASLDAATELADQEVA